MVLGNLTEYVEELEADSFRRGQAEAEAQERKRIAGWLRAAGRADAEIAQLMGLHLAVVTELFKLGEQ